MSVSDGISIDEILQRWAKQLYANVDPQEGCVHEPKEYIGFTEKYEFCLKCDAKYIDGIWRQPRSSLG